MAMNIIMSDCKDYEEVGEIKKKTFIENLRYFIL